MWRKRILAALLLRDNAASDEAVRERLDDLRPLHLGVRAAGLLVAMTMTLAAGLAAELTPLTGCAIAFVALHELHIVLVRRAPDVGGLERRLLFAGLLMVGWAVVAIDLTGARLPTGFLPLAVVLAGFSLILGARALLVLLAVGVVAAAAVLARDGVGGAWAEATAPETAWGLAAVRALAFAGFAAFAFFAQRRLRRAHVAMQHVVEELRVTEGQLSDSHAQLARANSDLALEGEREALLNRVAEVLQRRDRDALRVAMRLAMPTLHASEIAIVATPRG